MLKKKKGPLAPPPPPSERDTAAILTRRAKRKIPEYHALEEINLVPYLDVMVNLIIFILVTISTVLPLGILSVYPPASGAGKTDTEEDKPKPEDKPHLNFTVFINRDGFTIAGTGAVLPPIPKKGTGEYDYPALAQKALEIKDTYPEENKVIIAAEPDIKYDILIKVMDTLRNKGDKLLFYNVLLSPGIIGG